MQIKVTIIVPLYREREFVAVCLSFIESQSYKNWECLVVDDCGEDGSVAIAQSFAAKDPRFRILQHDHNRGASAARNTAIENAAGDYLYFLDADDRFVDNDSLEQLCEYAIDRPDWVQSGYLRSNGNVAIYGSDSSLLKRDQIVSQFPTLNFTNAAGKLVRREFITDNNLYFAQGITHEDVQWNMRAYALIATLSNTPKPTYYHNLRQNSTMRSDFTTVKVDSLQTILRGFVAAPQDANTRCVTAYYALFLLKNLLLAPFPKEYKRVQYDLLKTSGALAIAPVRSALPPFTRLLSYLGNSFTLSSLLCKIYRLK